MARVRTSVSSHKRKKRVLKAAKGHYGHRSKRFLQAKRSVTKAMVYSYRDRKVKKREFRALWITRINAACRENGINYSRFIRGLQTAKVGLDRKQLAELAINAPDVFGRLVDVAKKNVTK